MDETPSNPGDPERRAGPPPPARDNRPTPVRDALSDAAPPAPDVPPPGRGFALDGVPWWAEELGRTRTGRREDPGAVLLLVGFRPAEAETDAFQREALVQGESLDDFSHEELADLAAEAGPFRPLADEPRPFFGPSGRERGDGSPPPRGRGTGRRGRR